MNIKYLSFFLCTSSALAGTWNTGPLLAPGGKTLSPPHFTLGISNFYTAYPGGFRNFETNPILTVGVNDALDFQTSLPYDFNWQEQVRWNGIGDYTLALGLQLLNQTKWIPNLRFVAQEVFPTGRFEYFHPRKKNTQQTGIGAYQTFLGLNFERLTKFSPTRSLRRRLSLVALIPSTVHVHGLHAFGDKPITEGKMQLGNSYSVDLAVEYSFNDKWIPALDVLYTTTMPSRFSGNPGFTPGGTVGEGGQRGRHQVSLAPALECNLTPHFGIVSGVWLSITGPHADKFASAVTTINFYF